MSKSRRTLSLFFLACLFCGWGPSPARGEARRVATVMTRNVDCGTDFGYIFTAGSLEAFILQTYQELLMSNFAGRAGLLAKEIALQQPDFVALQEVALWQTGPVPRVTLADQLQLLLDALVTEKQHYSVVAVNSLTSVATDFLSFLDRDVILVRTERQSELEILNHQTGVFANLVNILWFLTIPRGWISVDFKVQGQTYRLVNTHLEDIDGNIRLLQAREAAQVASRGGFPAILTGDFNADAEPASNPSPSVKAILGAGFSDAWHALRKNDPGFTWPLYSEDQPLPTPYRPATPFQRIDLVFMKGLAVQAIQRTGTEPPRLLPSDHAGVVATLQTGK